MRVHLIEKPLETCVWCEKALLMLKELLDILEIWLKEKV